MLRYVALIVLGAVVASAPPPALAQTTPAGSSATQHTQAHRPTGSHRSQMRHRSNMHKERARAGAEHVRQMRVQ